MFMFNIIPDAFKLSSSEIDKLNFTDFKM